MAEPDPDDGLSGCAGLDGLRPCREFQNGIDDPSPLDGEASGSCFASGCFLTPGSGSGIPSSLRNDERPNLFREFRGGCSVVVAGEVGFLSVEVEFRGLGRVGGEREDVPYSLRMWVFGDVDRAVVLFGW